MKKLLLILMVVLTQTVYAQPKTTPSLPDEDYRRPPMSLKEKHVLAIKNYIPDPCQESYVVNNSTIYRYRDVNKNVILLFLPKDTTVGFAVATHDTLGNHMFIPFTIDKKMFFWYLEENDKITSEENLDALMEEIIVILWNKDKKARM